MKTTIQAKDLKPGMLVNPLCLRVVSDVRTYNSSSMTDFELVEVTFFNGEQELRWGGFEYDIVPAYALPVLCLENAKEGSFYRWCEGWQFVTKVYQLTDDYMKDNDLCYKNRATAITSFGDGHDFALVPMN